MHLALGAQRLGVKVQPGRNAQRRGDKERAHRRKKRRCLLARRHERRRQLPEQDQLLMALGAARKEAGRFYARRHITVPAMNPAVRAETFSFRCARPRRREGGYLLRKQPHRQDARRAVDVLDAAGASGGSLQELEG